MEISAISAKVKHIIGDITGLDPATIGDNDAFIEDLQLDSLSLLEIGVEVDYAFKLGVPEERLQELRTVKDSVDLVLECLNGAGEGQVEQTAAVA